MGSYFGKVPAVESLSHGCAVPAPFNKGAFGCPVTLPGGNRGNAPKPPGPLRGCLGTAEAGGFRRQRLRNFLPIPSSLFIKKPSPFHMGSYFGKVPAVESLSHGCAVPAPFNKGAFGCPVTLPGGNRGNAPKPPGPLRGCLGTAEAGGFRRQSLRNFLPIPSSLFTKKPSPFHMGSYFGKVPAVESLSHGCAVPAPFNKGAFGCPVTIPGGNRGNAPKPPLPKGGASAPPRRGDSAGKDCGTSYLFPIHFSLKTFPHWIFRNNKCLL